LRLLQQGKKQEDGLQKQALPLDQHFGSSQFASICYHDTTYVQFASKATDAAADVAVV
jgi:hypothetical protein